MLLSCSQNKNSIGRRLFEGLQQGIKRAGREHVHLVDDIDRILTYLRRNTHLVDQSADIIHRVVRSGIQFMDIERPLLVKRAAGFALVACVMLSGRIKTIDGLGKNAGTSGLTHSARSAEKISVRQMILADGIAQGLRQCLLPYDRLKIERAILACRNNIILHNTKISAQRYKKICIYANKSAELFA